MPAVYAGAGADIHNVIGRLHRFLVMLHHNDGVAEVPQVFQRLDEPCIIPLVQPDGRLIEDIQHPHQAGADLGRQPDTLTFPAGKGAGAAGQRQIIEPHIRKEGKPAFYFLDDLPGDFLLHLGQLQLVHEFQCFPHAHLAEIADIDSAHRYRQYFGTQPVTVAGRAGDSRHKRSDIILHPVAGGLLKAPLKVIDDALEVIGELPGKPGGMPHHLELFPLGAEQHKVQLILRHILDRDIQRHTEVLFQPGEVHLPDGTGVAAPARNLKGAVPDGTVGVAHHQRRVNLLEHTQPGAGGTASRRIIEGKHIGGKLLDGDIMVRAGIVLAEKHLLAAHYIHYHQPAGHGTAGLYRVRQTGADFRLDRKPVHHDLDGMLVVFLQLDLLGQLIHIAVYPGPDIAAAAGGVQLLLVGTLALPHDGRHHLNSGALRQSQHLIHHLVHRLLTDFPAADGAVGNTDSGI